MKAYRSRYEIIKGILEALPGHKTHIRYKTSDPVRYEEYFEFVESGDLMYKSDTTKKYYITDKGKHYLDVLNEILILQQKK